MKHLQATYSITTPMFLGGANQKATGLRVPSFKGALRFWWRALVWSDIEGADATAKLKALHQREANLFGTAAGRDSSAQSQVLLTINDNSLKPAKPSSAVKGAVRDPEAKLGITYLMGQGFDGRDALDGGNFTVDLTFRNGVSEQDRLSVERALLAFGLLGALGSRARKGFGSCSLMSLTGDRLLQIDPPKRRNDLGRVLGEVVGNRSSQQPEFTAFSSSALVDLSLTGDDALRVLGLAGHQMSEFRSEIRSDAQIAASVIAGQQPAAPPDRVAFGLPLPFFFRDTKTTVFFGVNASGGGKRDRRASPLLLHVHHFPEEPQDRYALIHTFLPARFLPARDGIKARATRRGSAPITKVMTTDEFSYQPILNYLDTFSSRSRVLS